MLRHTTKFDRILFGAGTIISALYAVLSLSREGGLEHETSRTLIHAQLGLGLIGYLIVVAAIIALLFHVAKKTWRGAGVRLALLLYVTILLGVVAYNDPGPLYP